MKKSKCEEVKMEKIEKVEVGRREGLRGRKEKEYVVESRKRGRK